MPNPRLAGRYAKSLMDLSIEKGQLEEVYADMQWLQAVCKNREFVSVLRSPVISNDKKNKVLTAITEGKVSALTAAFNRLLINKNRESFLPEIITAFISQYKTHKNIHIVKLTTATPVSETIKNEIVDKVKKTSGMQNIELETSVDESLIGGFVLQTGDKLIDASVSYDLKHISRQFDNNDFVYKVR
ncbi:MAG TPA: ATP synthase F1 subunit delta [Chitinophagaceae bacterium]|nr:ATP synthase F1 subunit delta [Chitinophagaceae bacterium]